MAGMTSVAVQTAVLFALPELDAYTTRWRSVSNAPDHPDLPLAARVPPHITVLSPWVPDPADPAALARLAAAVEGFGPLHLTFETADWFPDSGVVFLRPEPFDVLRDLLKAVAEAFPESPPYGGAYPEPHPHLTIASDGDAELLQEVRTALAETPPPTVQTDAVTVWSSPTGALWHQVTRIPLT